MRKCKFKEMIDSYLLNRLPEEEKNKFEEHYFNCHSCFETMVERDELISIIKSRGQSIFKDEYVSEEAKGETWSEKISSFLTPRQWATVAASALIITVIILAFLPKLFKPSPPQFFINEDRVRGESITLISPVWESETVPSMFKWKKFGEDTEYKIYIYDNGFILWQNRTKENFIVLPKDVREVIASGEIYSWQVKAFSPEGTLISVSSRVQFKISKSK